MDRRHFILAFHGHDDSREFQSWRTGDASSRGGQGSAPGPSRPPRMEWGRICEKQSKEDGIKRLLFKAPDSFAVEVKGQDSEL